MPRRFTCMEDTEEMNTLIVGKAISGFSKSGNPARVKCSIPNENKISYSESFREQAGY